MACAVRHRIGCAHFRNIVTCLDGYRDRCNFTPHLAVVINDIAGQRRRLEIATA